MTAYPTTPAPSGSTEIARRPSLPEKISYAEHLAQSGLLPSAYRRQPANVLYATEYGEMLGLAPLAAINGLHIIEGKPTASAGMVSALVRRAGHRLRSGYDKKIKAGWCEIVRHDDPDFTYRSEWTLDRAVVAELCVLKNGKPYARSKLGKPTPWELYPEAMMKARAITECARDACEEALNGVHYTPEELGAEVDESGEPIRVTSERADQATATAGEEMPDWEQELADAKGDVAALKALYKRAGERDPGNTGLAARIEAAGRAAAVKADAGEVLDAEVVTDSAPETEPAEQPLPPAPKPPEIARLLTDLRVIQADWWTLLTGIVGRQVRGPQDLRGEPLEAAKQELRNLAAAGEERERRIDVFMTKGVEILGRVARSQSVA